MTLTISFYLQWAPIKKTNKQKKPTRIRMAQEESTNDSNA